MKTLSIDLAKFSFYQREIVNGKLVKNRCGRDFVYNALAYYFPDQYGVGRITAFDLEHHKHLGISVPSWLAWTQVQFLNTPKYLKSKGLELKINGRLIKAFQDFVASILFSRMSFQDAIIEIEKLVDVGKASGIDISMGLGGLLDHVLFVYGYDDDNLYVFETIETKIQYSIVYPEYPQVKKLSKEEIKKRWTRFGRVWEVGVF
ncbi:MAG: hypothetical protein A3B11_00010 [Candidatus Taylorbacteria bacterium RIFCSPLOWO2_01_FULL_44_26]|uniref:Peptidase C39-like domain-containing protein n=2 Tax=Candidatus Tayloriibacteriota TaxID=1817919 RepID=A0A1G2MKZ4_9BACT|nr:MAG: hypothetical protein A3D50_01650 [Candidatus Taylorbacteria bacterium RIFCSPHIGHO2_02_FULL_44_12]OHA31079.1 MAG: hypothetical protein A3B11_00010 [Candidatus Taylorbacteria bacterium RIFCSPLOWO2_01_FULL_44_26]